MADAITIQELIDARTDAKTLEEAVNGDAVTTVLSRLGETYPTLSNALNQIDGQISDANDMLVESVTTLFTNGGLPATPFATKALMTASALVNGDYAMVTNDTEENNGLYIKESGSWVKSSYDPLMQANMYTQNKIEDFNNTLNKPVFKPKIEQGVMSKSTGVKQPPDNRYNMEGARLVDKIKLVKGSKFVVSTTAGSFIAVYLYDNDGNFIERLTANNELSGVHEGYISATFHIDSTLPDATPADFDVNIKITTVTDAKLTMLSNEVTAGRLVTDSDWLLGLTSSTDGSYINTNSYDTNRISLFHRIPLKGTIAVNAAKGWEARVLFFDSNNVFINCFVRILEL